MGYDFDGTARAALDAAEILLPKWMGGRREGREWVAERTKNGGIGNSWSVNLENGRWRHFAGPESGSDLISLYVELFRVTPNAARIEIERQLGGNSDGVPVLPPRAPRETASAPVAEPIPYNAPEITNHPRHGAHTAAYRYGDAFVVTRYDLPQGKAFAQWTWRRGNWVGQGYGPNRPLYQAHELDKHPSARVLIVEGEKCVHAAAPILTSYAVTTWSGGVAGIRQTDWSTLEGREVYIWPDADDPGRKAAADLSALLHNKAKSVRVINPNGHDAGWDVADAIDSGWDVHQLAEFMKAHVAEPSPPKNEVSEPEEKSPRQAGTAGFQVATDNSPSIPLSFAAMGLDCDTNGIPFVTLANASKILQFYDDFTGRIWFDEFRGQVYHTFRGPVAQPWTDRETRAVTVAIQQQLGLSKFHMDLIRHAITHAAECNAKHSLTDWLNGLEWDGRERLETWLADCAGVEFNDYSRAVARNWLVAMVARAYKPGCKMDNMPVLEGVSGLNKTQFLEVLGGEWYEAVPTEFGTKDFLQNIKGVWLAEIPDMTGFNRADHSTVISMLTVRFDKYRKAYGYESERHARTTIFAATSETDEYVGDARGKRRYWPIRCTDINLDGLRGQRDQLFAEAVQRYRDNAKWYEMPGSAAEEQNDRVTEDPWVRLILTYADQRWSQMGRVGAQPRIYMADILIDGLKLPPHQQGVRESRRVGAILKANGWSSGHANDGNYWRKKPPSRRDL